VRAFVTIDGQAWEEVRNWVETHLTPFFASVAFPQFPRLALVLRRRDRAKSQGLSALNLSGERRAGIARHLAPIRATLLFDGCMYRCA
jgi:hypothetical protein